MKIDNVKIPESSFLSLEKDASIIMGKMMENERLKKLLFYTTPDCLAQPNLTEDQTSSLFGKQIRIIPRFKIDPDVVNYLLVSFDSFYTNTTNPEFRNNLIYFDIICHYDQWSLRDYKLRPYRIAAEIDSMFNKKKLSGIGELEFAGAAQIRMDDEFAGLTMCYQAIHGGEDKKFMLNPADDKQFIEDFKEGPY